MVTLVNIPTDVLATIAVELALLDPLGPPRILSLLLTCRHIYSALRFENALHVYSRIFRCKFDTRAAARRIGKHVQRSMNQAFQLRKLSVMLMRVKSGDINSPWLENDLWTAFIMCLENDGRNEVQLDWAGLDSLVYDFLRTRLWGDPQHYLNGWPPESTINSLAIWIFWFRLDEVKLASLSGAQRDELADLVRPYVLTALRYPSFHVPDNHFKLPLASELRHEPPYLLTTPHGFWPAYREPDLVRESFSHYGEPLEISAPLIAVGAKLLFMTLHEAPIPYSRGQPLTREHALQMGRTYIHPTIADVDEANAHKSVQLVGHGEWDSLSHLTEEERRMEDEGKWRRGLKSMSTRWETDWYRLTSCYDPWSDFVPRGLTFCYGVLGGLWRGRMLTPDVSAYFSLVTSLELPATFSRVNPRMYTSPLYMDLREHHCINPQRPMHHGGHPEQYDDDVCNAWFPKVNFREANGQVRVQDEATFETATYETYVEGRPNSHDPQTCTNCLRRRANEEAELQARVRAMATESVTGETSDVGSRAGTPHPSSSSSSWAPSASDPPSTDPEVIEARMNANEAMGADVDMVLEDEMTNIGQPEDDRGSGSDDESEHGSEDDDEDAHMNEFVDDAGSSREPEPKGQPCNGVVDIIITGETLPRHGQAWNHYRFYGRVRKWDGLIAIVRIPVVNPALGITIFRGYIVGGQNFVGSWRAWTNNPHAIPLEGPFIMSQS